MKKQKARYVDGFVIAIPKKNLKAYKKMAEGGKKMWMEHGALDYMECVGDDLRPKGVKLSFPKLIKTKPGETVVFSFITFKSRAHRESVNAKVMADPRMNAYADKPMPFDMNRFSYGGFNVIVSA